MKKTIAVSSVAVLALLAGLFVFMWGCNSNSSNPYSTNPPSPPKTNQPNTVVIAGYAFSPSSMTVARNTTVTWQNNDSVVHTATSDNGTWDTGDIAAGGSKSVTFATAGTFTYHCARHPMMTATLIVQ